VLLFSADVLDGAGWRIRMMRRGRGAYTPANA